MVLLLGVREEALLTSVMEDGGCVLSARLRRGEVVLLLLRLQRRRRGEMRLRRTVRVDDGGWRGGAAERGGGRGSRVVEERCEEVRDAERVGELDGALERDPAGT